MVVGLTRALGSRSESIRRSATEILLGAGFAEEVVRGLGKPPAAEGDSAPTFAEIFRLADDGLPDVGVAAALGHLLGSESETASGTAARLLTRMSAGVDPANRWLVRAAIKSAVDVPALTGRTLSPDGAVAGGCIRRLFDLAHLTRQERQRFLAARGLNNRLSQLADADFRRGRLVDGRYGAVAVVETVVATGASKTGVRWTSPRRRAVVLRPVVLALNPKDDGYSVSSTGGALGDGLALSQRPIGRSPAYYYGLMEAMGQAAFVRGDSNADLPIGNGGVTVVGGPLELKSAAASEKPEPGTMRLEIADWLRAALQAASAGGGEPLTRTGQGKSATSEPPASYIPSVLTLSLRYTRFGGYCGTLPRRSLPARASTGDRHLLNVMLILEKMD